MGIHQEKYTKNYFLGQTEDGTQLNYGVEKEFDAEGRLVLRKQDRTILEKLDFTGKRILCLGCGRGDEIKYVCDFDKGAHSCVAVDFSESAIQLTDDLIKNAELQNVETCTMDAIEFIRDYLQLKFVTGNEKFDIVIALDFIEHVPRDEAYEIFKGLYNITTEQCLIAINTPCYKFDNDVVKDGYDERNSVNCYDTSDINPATAGMHCNKYTCISLQNFMKKCGFLNLTQAQYFVKESFFEQDLYKKSYFARWKIVKNKGVAIKSEYQDDVVEYPYSDVEPLNKYNFDKGALKDISLYVTESYKNFVYKDGNIDAEAIMDFEKVAHRKRSLVIFDVGGFVGANSLVYAKMTRENSKIVVFEPNPYNRCRIYKNLSANELLQEKIIVEPLGLTAKDGIVLMTLSSEIDNGFSSTSRIDSSHAKIHEKELPNGFFEEQVYVTTLDKYVENTNTIPDVIKVDIEGAEFMMLSGSVRTIVEHKPIIYIEYHSEYCATKCTELLIDCGYSIDVLCEEEDNRIIIKAQFVKQSEKTDKQLFEQFSNSFDGTSVLLKTISKHNITISQQDTELQAKDTELQTKDTQLQAKDTELQTKDKQLQAKDTQLQAKDTQLQAKDTQLQAKDTQLQAKDAELRDARNLLAVAFSETTKILNSRSYKITKPLRIFKNIFMKKNERK